MKKDINFIKQVLEPGYVNHYTEEFAKAFGKFAFDKIVAIETLGFILGGALAAKLNKSLVLIRKGGTSETTNPDEFEFVSFTDHSESEKTFRIWKESIFPGDRVALIDDYAATTSAIRAATKLLSSLGARIDVVGLVSADSKAQFILGHECAHQYVSERSNAFHSIIIMRREASGREDEWEDEAQAWWKTLFDNPVKK